MNTQAQDIEEQLDEVYVFFNAEDVARLVIRDEITPMKKAKHLNFGYDQSYDESLTVIYYQDGSMLKISATGIEASSNRGI